MKLYAIRIFVDDWHAACDFYEHTLGLRLEFKNEQFGWAEFDVGGAKFGIERAGESPDGAQGELVGRFVGVSLQVDDMAATYENLKAQGVHFLGEPEKQQWGGTLAHLEDPSGNILTLISEIQPG